MSEITPNDLPPINELDEFTSHIPELQTDTDVLAGTDGPANFQAQALANRTKHLKSVLDAVSLELTEINQAVAAAQQSADTAKQGADASMKKAANGVDIADKSAFRANLGVEVQTSSTDATPHRILKLAANGQGSFGLGGSAIAIPAGSTIPTYFNNLPTGFYRAGSNITGTFSPICDYSWIRHDANNGVLIAVGIGAIGAMAFRLLSAGVWSDWRTVWHDGNITLAGMYADRGSLGTTDLNTLFGADYRGNWYQSVTATATLARNYPIVSSGTLEIQYTGANIVGTVQRYTTHASNRIFIRYKLDSAGAWSTWTEIWTSVNLTNPMTLDTAQTISGEKTFTGEMVTQGVYPHITLTSTRVAVGTVGRQVIIEHDGTAQNMYFVRNNAVNNTGRAVIYMPMAFNGSVLVTGNNAVADSSGFWKTASPVINIYSDGSFTATDEADGVNVERLSEGVYKITGCQGMHSDAAWNGIDGGVSNPKCRNGQELTWNNYEVDEDGSVTVYTFHRVHPEAMPFAQNRLTLDKEPFDPEKGHTPDMEWPDQTPIDVPRGLFIQVRVNMPEHEPVKPAVNHSNAYCNTVSPAK